MFNLLPWKGSVLTPWQYLAWLDLAASDSKLQVLSLHLHFSNTSPCQWHVFILRWGTTREAGEGLWVNALMGAREQLAFSGGWGLSPSLLSFPLCCVQQWFAGSLESSVTVVLRHSELPPLRYFRLKLKIVATVKGKACCVSPICSSPVYLGWLMPCHPICHLNSKLQKTAQNSSWCKYNLPIHFPFHWHLRLLTFSPNCLYTVPLKLPCLQGEKKLKGSQLLNRYPCTIDGYQGKLLASEGVWGFGWGFLQLSTYKGLLSILARKL